MYALCGPKWSRIGSIRKHAGMVTLTAAMLMLAIWPMLRWNSPLITGISGATANQAKKQTKNASHDMWKARLCGMVKFNGSMRVALWETGAAVPIRLEQGMPPGRRRSGHRPGGVGVAARRCPRDP